MKPLQTRRTMLALGCAAVSAMGPGTGSVRAAEDPAYLYTATRGDTLIGLGKRLLVDPARWPEPARANALIDPQRIASGVDWHIRLRLMRSTSAPAAWRSSGSRLP